MPHFVFCLNGGTPRAVTPDEVSPDGKFLIGADSQDKIALFPVHGGTARVVPGLNSGLIFVQWSEDGRSLYASDRIPATIYRVDLASGHKTVALRLDPAVLDLSRVVLSRDGKTYAYNYRRILSTLLVAEGLK